MKYLQSSSELHAKITLSVAVSNSSPNLQNAYEFIKFLLSEEFQLETIKWRYTSFSVLDAANEAYYQYETTGRSNAIVAKDSNPFGFESIDAPREEFDELMAYADQVTDTFYISSQTRFLGLIQECLEGETSYRDAAKAAQSQLNIYLSE